METTVEQQLFERGETLIKERKHAQALDCLLPLLSRPLPADHKSFVRNSVGRVYLEMGQLDCGITYLESAREQKPQSPDILANLALAYKWKGDLPRARDYAAASLRIHPWHNAAQFTQAMVNLIDGDYERGFEQYECRWRDPNTNLQKPTGDKPEWDGRNGKRVYVYGEQGSGDSMLMLRYARAIRERGLEQVWVTQNGMKPLVETIPEIDEVIQVGDEFPECDCVFPAASLPRVFRTTLDTIPSSPYIPKPEALDLGEGFHVGVVWRGAKTQLNDSFRSTSLNLWQPVFDVPGVIFHSLQVENAEEGLVYPLVQHAQPKDWLETARLVCGMNLVISVDTSMVHLCGAMGVPCWCALHSRPYFVYPLARTDCPWYSSVRLFKCKKDFAWPPVFANIAKELCSVI